jgi:hypothetical protein
LHGASLELLHSAEVLVRWHHSYAAGFNLRAGGFPVVYVLFAFGGSEARTRVQYGYMAARKRRKAEFVLKENKTDNLAGAI